MRSEEWEMDYEEWKRAVPREITSDALWNVEAYRLALFMSYLGWRDVTKLITHHSPRHRS